MTRFSDSAWHRCVLVVAVATLTACSGRDPRTPEEAAKRGDELLRKMSDTLKAAPALSFTVAESHERVRRNGQKEPYTLNREVVIRRPDRLWSHTTGSDNRNIRVTYDGNNVTIVGDTQKIYATFKAAATLDETLDLASERYDLHVAVADFLYSSPYDSFADSEAKGGWVRRTMVDGKSCEEVSYTAKAVDFTVSVTSAEPTLPCQAQITYKEEPGQPITRLVFANWNLRVQPQDAQFVANVPQGYELIPVVERIPKTELKTDPAKKRWGLRPPSDAADRSDEAVANRRNHAVQ
jgi:hypothetical protein